MPCMHSRSLSSNLGMTTQGSYYCSKNVSNNVQCVAWRVICAWWYMTLGNVTLIGTLCITVLFARKTSFH
jgi:hypothetical protein